MNTEEQRAQWRAYYYRHHDKYRAEARERATKRRAVFTETPEEAVERRRKNREWYAQNAVERREKRKSYSAKRRGDEPLPDLDRRRFLTIMVGILTQQRMERLAKRRKWQHQRYGTKERIPAPPKPPKRIPMTKEEIRKKRTDAMRERRRNDPYLRLANSLRRRVNEQLSSKGIKKLSKTMGLVGCTVFELKQHLEQQFQSGMTWLNFGSSHGCWNVDHLRPLASFDLRDEVQQREAFHWSNLSPRWKLENISKGSSWNGRRWRYSDHSACVPAAPA